MSAQEDVVFDMPLTHGWLTALDGIIADNDVQSMKGKIEDIVQAQIELRFPVIFFDKYQLGLFIASVNAYIQSKRKEWPKNYLKAKARKSKGRVEITLFYHDYTYKYNVFKKEVIFYDAGVEIYTYSSEWVKAHVGHEDSICHYALEWMRKNGSRIIEDGYELRKVNS